MAFTIRNKIQSGNIVKYKDKKYIIINKYYAIGGNSMVIELIKYTPDEPCILKRVMTLHDTEIKKIEILK